LSVTCIACVKTAQSPTKADKKTASALSVVGLFDVLVWYTFFNHWV